MEPKAPRYVLRFVTYLVIGVAILVVSIWTLYEQAPIHIWAKEALAFETDPLDYDLFIAADISGGLYLLYRAFRVFVGI